MLLAVNLLQVAALSLEEEGFGEHIDAKHKIIILCLENYAKNLKLNVEK